MKKTCEICKMEYSQNIKYCPNCGTKNSSFKESDQIVNDFKKSIEKNSYFKVKVENEMKKINKEIGRKTFDSSGSTTVKESSKNHDASKNETAIICPNCSAKNDKNTNFCINCGENLNKNYSNEEKICPNCGYRSSIGKYCLKCGALMKDI